MMICPATGAGTTGYDSNDENEEEENSDKTANNSHLLLTIKILQ